MSYVNNHYSNCKYRGHETPSSLILEQINDFKKKDESEKQDILEKVNTRYGNRLHDTVKELVESRSPERSISRIVSNEETMNSVIKIFNK